MSKYKIEKNIPVEKYRGSRFPFKDMEVGDSILVPLSDGNGARATAYSLAARQTPEWKFTSSITEDGQSYRIWRVV